MTEAEADSIGSLFSKQEIPEVTTFFGPVVEALPFEASLTSEPEELAFIPSCSSLMFFSMGNSVPPLSGIIEQKVEVCLFW
jgi:hypothetical protein